MFLRYPTRYLINADTGIRVFARIVEAEEFSFIDPDSCEFRYNRDSFHGVWKICTTLILDVGSP